MEGGFIFFMMNMMNNLAYARDESAWREELIAGTLVAMAPGTVNHNRVKGNIYRIFSNYLVGRTCEALPDGTAVYLTETDYYIPDVTVVCEPERIQWNGVHGAPDLVVEVLSPRTAKQDRGRKKEIYEASGVPEYWIVTPGEKTVEQYVLEGGRYVLRETYTLFPPRELEAMTETERARIATEFRCSLDDGLVIRLEEVFARVP